MSYCRFAWGGSDVYVYESLQGLECCGCRLDGLGVTFDTPEEMIAHLGEHRRAGHFVPDYAITALWEDIPGAQRPSEPEPESLTRSSVMVQIAWHEGSVELLRKKLETMPSDD